MHSGAEFELSHRRFAMFRKAGTHVLKFLRDKPDGFIDQRYLLGLRGVLVIQSFLWVFLQTFVPATVKSNDQTEGPHYQNIIRKSLSVIFWNESLISSTFVLLSARTICLPFLKNSTKTFVASACFRRGLRLWFPVAVALALVKIILSSIGTTYIEEFKEVTGATFSTPYHLKDALSYFNSVFGLFWTTFNFASQAGSKAFPSGTLWIVNVIYAQSYTVYMTMVIVPYTRERWRVEAFGLFILTAWWVQSWAWYTITGLLFADAVINMDFKAKAMRGLPFWKVRIPVWLISGLLMAAGLCMQYLWTAWRPQIGNVELTGHAGLYYTGGLNIEYDLIQPQARDDNYVFLVGFLLFLESSDVLQRIMANPFFTYLGSRSLSKFGLTQFTYADMEGYFLIQSTIVYTAGIKVYLALGTSPPVSTVASLVVCLVALVPGAEIFHRLVDSPSRVLSHQVFDWIRE